MTNAELRLELTSGLSEQGSLNLRRGQPVDPFSVGPQGSWPVHAPGIAPVAAHLYFDGTTLFISSVPGAPAAMINGQPAACDWVPLAPPCEIRLGVAALTLVERACQPEPASRPGFVPPGVHGSGSAPPPPKSNSEIVADPLGPEMDFDDADEPQARFDSRESPSSRLKRPKILFVGDDDEATRVDPKSAAHPIPGRKSSHRRKPKLPACSSDDPTHIQPIGPETTPTLQMPELPRSQPASIRHDAGRSSEPPSHPAALPPPRTVVPITTDAMPSVVLSPEVFQLEPTQVAGSAPARARAHATRAPAAVPRAAFMDPGFDPSARHTKPPTHALVKRSQALARVIQVWKGASIPQKIILVLLPFAFAAALIMFGRHAADSKASKPAASAPRVIATPSATFVEPPASRSAQAATSTEAPPPQPARTATATTSASSAASSSARAPKRPGKTAPKTLDREAADAVARGAWADALASYQQLAAQHPDNPVYREAVRILRSKQEEGNP